MKSFIKTTIKMFTPLWVRSDFSTYSEEFIKIRSNMNYKCDKCFKCDKPFKLGDTVGLVAFKGIGNKVLCQNCADEIK